ARHLQVDGALGSGFLNHYGTTSKKTLHGLGNDGMGDALHRATPAVLPARNAGAVAARGLRANVEGETMMSRPFVISLAAALLLSLGCSGDGGYGGDGGDGGNGGPTGPQNNGRLEGEVTGPGGGIPGAEVAIEGGGSTETDEDGSYSISNVAPGTKTVTVTPPDGF